MLLFAIIFQFAIATVLSVAIRNLENSTDAINQSVDNLQAAGLTCDQIEELVAPLCNSFLI